MAVKPKQFPKGDTMTLTLRATHVTPHPDGTQTVTLSPIGAEFRPLGIGRPIPSPVTPGEGPGRGLPVPAPFRTPPSILITNWPNSEPFHVGREYRVDIQAV